MVRAKQKSKATQTNEPSFSALINVTVWITGVLVSLAVGFGMIEGKLSIWWISDIITAIAGWIVVVLTLLGVVLAIIQKLGG